jgi:predicted DNA-binding protein with PD1-like motif
LIRLAIGEEVISTLTEFVRQQQIRSGWLSGIGAVSNTVLGIYDLKRRRYRRRMFRADHELLSLAGGISWLGKDPVLHVHAVLADAGLRAIGGHLFQARCCVTVEVMLEPWPTTVRRRPDPETGLNLLAL